MNGESWSIADAAAVAAELERELEARRRAWPELVRKGGMDKRDADRRLAILAEIRGDLDIAFGPGPWILPAPLYDWETKHRELERTLESRRKHYPDQVRRGMLTAEQAKRRIELLQAAHDLYWRQMFGWPAPAGGIEAAIAGARAHAERVQQRAAAAAEQPELGL